MKEKHIVLLPTNHYRRTDAERIEDTRFKNMLALSKLYRNIEIFTLNDFMYYFNSDCNLEDYWISYVNIGEE